MCSYLLPLLSRCRDHLQIISDLGIHAFNEDPYSHCYIYYRHTAHSMTVVVCSDQSEIDEVRSESSVVEEQLLTVRIIQTDKQK